jgi:hypothetical protein
MGMDPLLGSEAYEVTIILEGPVKKTAFRQFRAQLDSFIDACGQIDDGTGRGKKLQVRESRTGVRRTA